MFLTRSGLMEKTRGREEQKEVTVLMTEELHDCSTSRLRGIWQMVN